MAIMSGSLVIACLTLGLLHALRLVVRRTDMIGEASHAVMGFGMAAMFSPLGDPVPAPVWITLFVLALAWFGATAIRIRSLGGEVGHHVVGSVAMLFMLLGRHGEATAGGGGAEHAGHHGGGATTGGLGLGVVAIVLSGYFAWHVLRCADRLRPVVEEEAMVAALGAPALALRIPVIGAARTVAVSHLLMAVAMTVMLLGMV